MATTHLVHVNKKNDKRSASIAEFCVELVGQRWVRLKSSVAKMRLFRNWCIPRPSNSLHLNDSRHWPIQWSNQATSIDLFCICYVTFGDPIWRAMSTFIVIHWRMDKWYLATMPLIRKHIQAFVYSFVWDCRLKITNGFINICACNCFQCETVYVFDKHSKWIVITRSHWKITWSLLYANDFVRRLKSSVNSITKQTQCMVQSIGSKH